MRGQKTLSHTKLEDHRFRAPLTSPVRTMTVHTAELARIGDTTIIDDTDVGPWTVLALKNSSCAAANRQPKIYGQSAISSPFAVSASTHGSTYGARRTFPCRSRVLRAAGP